MVGTRLPRCHCGHSHDTHEHFRPGHDCGACGPGLCYRYAPRDRPLPESHRLAAAISDAHAMANAAALMPFAISTRTPVRIPQQRRPPPRRQGGQIVNLAALQRPRSDRRPQ